MTTDSNIVAAATHPVLTDGDARLRRHAARVQAFDAPTRAAAAAVTAALGEAQRAHGFGRALAAPQIGIASRLVAIDLGAGPWVMANPEVVPRSDETMLVWDDCFSLPDRLVRVRRYRSVDVRYQDLDGRPRLWRALDPDLSALVQHEVDHLDGVLMIDRAEGPDAVQPAGARATLIDAERPAHRLSLARIAEAARTIAPVFRGSPQYECEPLGAALGCRLTIKVETANPIRSFKGRGADYFVSQLVASGQTRPLVCGSAGNFGQALAYVCRQHQLPLTVFAARSANALKLERMRALGAEVRLAGDDFDAAKAAARRFAETRGAHMVEDGLEPAISEGAGSLAVELLAASPALDALLVPLGNGALLTGVARWAKAASPATRIIGVCSRGAPAMAEAWRHGLASPAVAAARADTIADGIAVRVPIAEAVADLDGLVDDLVLVDDDTLVAAIALCHRHTGLLVEPAGVAGIAAILADRGRFTGEHVATILCGSNVTVEQARVWLA